MMSPAQRSLLILAATFLFVAALPYLIPLQVIFPEPSLGPTERQSIAALWLQREKLMREFWTREMDRQHKTSAAAEVPETVRRQALAALPGTNRAAPNRGPAVKSRQPMGFFFESGQAYWVVAKRRAGRLASKEADWFILGQRVTFDDWFPLLKATHCRLAVVNTRSGAFCWRFPETGFQESKASVRDGDVVAQVTGFDASEEHQLLLWADVPGEGLATVWRSRLRFLLHTTGAVALGLIALILVRYNRAGDGQGGRMGRPVDHEPALTELMDALETAQEKRLGTMGALAAGVVHEINQPLNALKLNASGLAMLVEQERRPSDSALLERLQQIVRQADRVSTITRHMRDLVRLDDKVPLEAVCIAEALDGAIGLVGRQLESHSISLKQDLADELPKVCANALQLELVLINLLVNAQQAFDRQADGTPPIIEIKAWAHQDKVRLSVSDNGPGLEHSDGSVFQPFLSGSGSSGLGVGLHLVQSFVHGWGAEVSVESNESGTCFHLILKVAAS